MGGSRREGTDLQKGSMTFGGDLGGMLQGERPVKNRGGGYS